MKELLLAIEGGGTKTRILLADAGGHVLAEEVGGPASGLYIQPADYAKAVRPLLERIKRASVEHGSVARVGLGGPMDASLVKKVATAVFGKVAFVTLGEGEVALAVHGLHSGVSLTVGTGSSCRALNEAGASASCGGFGPQFGDEGSGYWIGRSAVTAVMLARDGRSQPTVLTSMVCEALGLSRIGDVYGLADRSGHVAGPQIAALTPLVFEAVRHGDAIARGIIREAGHELGRLVLSTARQLEWEHQPVPLVLSGGVLHGGWPIINAIRHGMQRAQPRFKFYPPIPEPAVGIIQILVERSPA